MKVFECLTAGSGSFLQTGWVRICTLGLLLMAFVQCSQGSGDAGDIAQGTVAAAEPTSASPMARVSTVGLPSNDTFVRVSKEAMASVVNISTTRKVEESQQDLLFLMIRFSDDSLVKSLNDGFVNPRNVRNRG